MSRLNYDKDIDTQLGSRSNSGKPKLSMIDTAVLNLTAEVLEFGAKKYARDNWKKGLKYTEVVDSLMRHTRAFIDGEDVDPESGLSHIGHMACNVMFLARFVQDKRVDLDDRTKTTQCPIVDKWEEWRHRGYSEQDIEHAKRKEERLSGKNERDMGNETRTYGKKRLDEMRSIFRGY